MANSIFRRIRQKPSLSNRNRTTFLSPQPAWKVERPKIILPAIIAGIILMLYFLGICSYLYGSVYLSSQRHHNFRILAVDYDGGIIGQAVRNAYQQLKGRGFVSVEFHSPQDYASEDEMYHAVWKGNFWGAILTTKGASDRLSAALQGGLVASNYNASDAIHYIWNQQLYPAFSMSIVYADLQTLVGATSGVYNAMTGTQATQTVNRNDPAAIRALLNPISSTETNIKPAPFGASVLLNTVGTVTPILSQFFYLLVLNGVARGHQLYSRLTFRSSFAFRRIATIVYSLGAALCQAGYTWALREEWNVNGNQFVLSWMTWWITMYAHCLLVDTVITAAPMPVMPFVILGWAFLNIASTLSPFEMQPGFYKWSYALPGHNCYEILMTIWTGGAHNRLYRNLPILFAWVVAGTLTTAAAHLWACHMSYKLERKDDVQMEDLHKPFDEERNIVHSSDGVPISEATTMHKDDEEVAGLRTGDEVYRTPTFGRAL